MSDRDWTLRVAPTEAGVEIQLALADLGGQPVTAVIALDRAEARHLARALLAAAGDAAERTFPHPAPPAGGQ
ncbi:MULTISPECIES: hypothetical protein [Methylobacterium]|jgi:hypothetical protein|uniref:Uncharacterized protein n=1 Tax=Methylobacterium isbiliense TaxID=315478 RepID=A0ABQ4S888_9HYPH|nr:MULTISPECIES: hypothetical protein [Methylobacterium]MBY0299357.1 hypothetical protein [Methylobacterium sp.]MDN3622089.1 hypothetical protein [Methylobacterium isbiliense]GJD99398.1 hypothetical protein GMJLKIPL_1315 [Methylobacterium isbiliense]